MEKAIDYCLYLWLMITFAASGSYCQNLLRPCVAATSNDSTTIHLTVSNVNVTYITSPHFKNPYPGNLDLNWTIVVPGSNVLLLRLISFELEADNNTKCPADSLSIYDPADSSKDLELCGQTLQATMLFPYYIVCTRGNTAFIRFRTDASWCYDGFNMSIEAISTSHASNFSKCFETTSTTATLTSTISQSTSVTKSITSRTETVPNSWSTSSASSNISTFASASTTEDPKGPNTGAIVGGVVGGLLAAGLLVGLFVFLKPRLCPVSVEAEKDPHSDNTDDKTPSRATSALFSPPTLIREPTCAPAATFPEPRPLTARKH